MKLVYADFMKMDFNGRLILSCYGTHRDLVKQKIQLSENQRLVFYNEDEDIIGNKDDLVVEGVVTYDKQNERWVASINWDEIKNISQLTIDEKEKLGIK